MVIGIDGNEANVEKQVGVSTYTLNLLTHFKSVANSNQKFRIFLKKKPAAHMPKENEWFHYVVLPFPFFWLYTTLSFYLFFHRDLDVFFAPAHYSPAYCPAPLVVTIHDLSFYYFPEEFLKKDLYKLKKWTRNSITKASRIISVSEATQKDVLRHYDVKPDKLRVVYNGFTKHTDDKGKSKILKTNGLKTKDYLLYVGTLQPRKNLLVLVDAFQVFHETHPNSKLVIAGKKGWLYDNLFQHVKKLGLEKYVIFTGYVNDTDLGVLYKNALCFILPSLYEGFGLPILEAMYHSCPVITSFSSSLPEVGGDACLYFDPHNSRELSEKIELMTTESNLRQEYIMKGRKRISFFSWKNSAEKTLDILQEAASYGNTTTQ